MEDKMKDKMKEFSNPDIKNNKKKSSTLSSISSNSSSGRVGSMFSHSVFSSFESKIKLFSMQHVFIAFSITNKAWNSIGFLRNLK